MITLYGIKNCDTIKKARQWLTAHGIDYHFHDYREHGIDRVWLQERCRQVGWETLLNTRGTTFRQLDAAQKTALDEDKAIALMLDYPAMIKRPVLISNEHCLVGFKAAQYEQLFDAN